MLVSNVADFCISYNYNFVHNWKLNLLAPAELRYSPKEGFEKRTSQNVKNCTRQKM